jgi:hypothetical protein
METNKSIDSENKDEEQLTNNIQKVCLICKKDKIEYLCMPCRCDILCKNCAMKIATGGKCRNCNELFVECKRII